MEMARSVTKITACNFHIILLPIQDFELSRLQADNEIWLLYKS